MKGPPGLVNALSQSESVVLYNRRNFGFIMDEIDDEPRSDNEQGNGSDAGEERTDQTSNGQENLDMEVETGVDDADQSAGSAGLDKQSNGFISGPDLFSGPHSSLIG